MMHAGYSFCGSLAFAISSIAEPARSFSIILWRIYIVFSQYTLFLPLLRVLKMRRFWIPPEALDFISLPRRLFNIAALMTLVALHYWLTEADFPGLYRLLLSHVPALNEPTISAMIYQHDIWDFKFILQHVLSILFTFPYLQVWFCCFQPLRNSVIITACLSNAHWLK